MHGIHQTRVAHGASQTKVVHVRIYLEYTYHLIYSMYIFTDGYTDTLKTHCYLIYSMYTFTDGYTDTSKTHCYLIYSMYTWMRIYLKDTLSLDVVNLHPRVCIYLEDTFHLMWSMYNRGCAYTPRTHFT